MGTIRTRRAALVVGRGRGRTVGSANARVVLGTAPRQTNARITDRVTLHLIDRHLGGVSVNELNETTALSRRDLDVCYLAKALEEGTELIFGNIARETTNKDGSVVGISELVHLGRRLHATITLVGIERTRLLHAPSHTRLHAGIAHHGTAMASTVIRAVLVASSRTTLKSASEGRGWLPVNIPLFRSGSANAHWTIAAINTLHFHKSTLLIALVREADKTVTAGLASGGVGHDLGALARGKAGLEQRHQNVLGDLRTKVADKDGEFGAAIVTCLTSASDSRFLAVMKINSPSVNETTTRSPIKLELTTLRARNGLASESERLVGSLGGRELDEAVAGVAF